MSAMVDLEIAGEFLERSKVDLVVTGFFSDELPLRGGVGRADWRMCGQISEQILAGRIKGDVGEALLLPSSGRLSARRVMVLGLGERGNYRLNAVREGVRDAVERGLALGAASLAMSPLGLAGDDFVRCAEATVEGIAAGFADSERSLRVRIVLPESELQRATRALDDALGREFAAKLRFARQIAQALQSPEDRNRAAQHRPSPRQ